jgi:hypothetical protein
VSGDRISALDAAGTLDGSELVPLVQGGDTKAATASQLSAYASGTGNFLLVANNLSDVTDDATAVVNIGAAYTVATLAALKALTARPEVVIVEGGQAKGVWQWELASSTTADDGLVVTPTSGTAGRYKRVYDGPVNVVWFGAVGDGTTDDTVAIQAAINCGATSVYIPSKTFLVSNLLMPNVFNFVLFGDGPSSILKQKSGASNAMIYWATASIVYNEQTVHNLGIIGTSGSQHSIDLSGSGGTTVHDIYFTDVPAGKTGIYMNGAAATQVHDLRVRNIQIYYSSSAGHSGIRCGPLCTDSEIEDFIMNGGLNVDYCIYMDSGAIANNVRGSHPYNAKINVMKLVGSNDYCSFNDVDFDRAEQNVVEIEATQILTFTHCHFRAVQSSKSAVNITGASKASFVNCKWQGEAGSTSCVVADSSTSNIFIFGGSIASTASFSTLFNLGGTASWARGIAGFNPMGLDYALAGCAASTQAQNTTEYLGVNGSNATESAVVYMTPYAATCNTVFVAVTSTPAAGQTFTFRARKNGVDVGSSLVISNGSFSGTMTVAATFAQHDQFTISSVFSATSGSARTRFSAKFTS